MKIFIQEIWNKCKGIVPFLRLNKYSVCFILFLVWISFFDRYSLVTQYKLTQNIEELELDKQTYLEDLDKAEEESKNLHNNREKFAREKYYFHKPNEEVIIIK